MTGRRVLGDELPEHAAVSAAAARIGRSEAREKW
jgi:hypothetical protein